MGINVGVGVEKTLSFGVGVEVISVVSLLTSGDGLGSIEGEIVALSASCFSSPTLTSSLEFNGSVVIPKRIKDRIVSPININESFFRDGVS